MPGVAAVTFASSITCVPPSPVAPITSVAGLPLGDTSLRYPAVVTVNVLGPESGEPAYDRIPDVLRTHGLHLHLYGKASRPRRKIGKTQRPCRQECRKARRRQS